MEKIFNQQRFRLIIYAGMLSLSGLLVVFALKIYRPALLEIDVKWLIVCLLPIVLALLIGGFVSKFSWMGVNVEMVTNQPVIELPGVVDFLEELKVIDKEEVHRLINLNVENFQDTNTLVFYIGSGREYNVHDIRTYLTAFPNVRFFLVKNKFSDNNYLLKIDRYRLLRGDERSVEKFIEMLNEGRIENTREIHKIKDGISEKATIIDAYNLVNASKETGIMVYQEGSRTAIIGLIRRDAIEKYLAKQFINMLKEK